MADLSAIDSLTETDCAYMAGLIDGEGSVYIMKHGGKTFYPAIAIMMTDEIAVRWFAEKFGLSVANVPRTPEKWRDQYSVRLHGKRAVALCARLLPYLKTKRRQAELVLTFPFEDRRGRPPRGRSLPLQIVSKRAELRKQINSLNARGPR